MNYYFTKLIGEWNGVAHVDHKLYLCSRVLKVGDVVIREVGDLIYFHEEIGAVKNGRIYMKEDMDHEGEYGICYRPETCYKVIGEVSPEATWIKEGDEFGGEYDGNLQSTGDFKLYIFDSKTGEDYTNKHSFNSIRHWPNQDPQYRVGVRFRCPSSPNHFH